MTATELTADIAPTPAAYLKAARAVAAGEVAGLRPLRVAVLAAFTAQFLEPYLVVEGARRGFVLAPWFAPWGQIEQQALDAASELYAQRPEVIVIFPARAEGLDSLLRALRSETSAPVFLANFPPSENAAQENATLAACAEKCADVFVFDLARVAMDHGLRTWRDPKLFFLARVPFGVSAQIAIGRALARTIRAAFVPPARVLALDLDNTLWGGVLGEDGPVGIALGDEYPGNVFKAFQHYLRTLKERGVLLAVVSKNNAADVDEVLAKHRDCVLRREDFAAWRVNWDEKSANLRAVAAELNLGLETIVFFDDQAFEREEVRRHLPTVSVIDVPDSPLGYVETIEESGLFDQLRASSEDRSRTELYRKQAARAGDERTHESREDFLRSLEMVATIGAVDAGTLPRVAQLLAKTNQFNLTTRRHSAAEIAALIGAGAVALWMRLADRFGDNGLVGVALALPDDAGCWRLDTFLLSCRVIGRGAETALLAEVAARCGSGSLIGEFLPTPKNGPAADFYPRHGFVAAGGDRWVFDLGAATIAPPDFIRVERA